MDYDTGHVRYCLAKMVDHTGVSEASIKRHIGYLRELGALAWVVHGTKTNVRRALGMKGYAATATVYAAVIPPAYDHAKGHKIVGSGYEARVVVDHRGQARPVDNSPVDKPGSTTCEPPSLTLVKEDSQVQMVGGVTTTAQRQPKTSPARKTNNHKKRATILGATVTAAGMQLGNKLAQAIHRRVPWTRKASHDELRWICADMGENGWTEQQAVAFAAEAGYLRGADAAWQPHKPHRVLAAELRDYQQHIEREEQLRADQAAATTWTDPSSDVASLAQLFGSTTVPAPTRERTDEDRLRARMDWNIWPQVLEHLDEDPDDADDLYGAALCKYAIGQSARLSSAEYGI